ncbi:MAG: lytic transglycosylase domain-containing protein [Candidatus Aenigmarchaeota archaeon]|nr:lytic transglycosylase domain-containing protein [Candidatus Aenigmarchaeota archaeon]
MNKHILLLVVLTMIILALLFVVFWSFGTWGVIGEAFRTSAVLHTEQMVGIINMLNNAPAGTTHAYELPAVECVVSIDYFTVNSTIFQEKDSKTYSLGMIEAPVGIDVRESLSSAESCKQAKQAKRPDETIICCSPDAKKTIYFIRCFKNIIISDKDTTSECRIDPHTCDYVLDAPVTSVNIDELLNSVDISPAVRIFGQDAKQKIKQMIAYDNSRHYNADGSVYITANGIGLMQLTPEMIDDAKKLCDPQENLKAAMQRMSSMLDAFQAYGDDRKKFALAAYKFGIKYVDRYVNTGDKWDDIRNKFTPELIYYVESLMNT